VAHRLIDYRARAFVHVAVVEKSQSVGVFFVNDAHTRDWHKEDLSFIREVAARTRMALGRRQAERDFQALAASLELQVEQRTRERDRVWRNTQDLSVIIDRTGALAAVNPATTKILGWTEEEVLRRSVFDLIVPEDAGDTREALEWVRREVLANFQNRFRHRSGGFRWISWVAALDGDFIYASGRDITAEKEAAEALAASEEALRQSQKMEAVGQLTGGLAHDFNNILAGVQGSLDLMRMRMAQGRTDELERYLRAAESAIKRAAGLTHRLLAFSRRQTLDPKLTNINQLVSGMEELIQRSVGPEIAVQSKLHEDLWNALVDAGQLENGLLNLCLNARDAMVGGGKLTIETGNKELNEQAARQLDLPAGQYVALCVTDTGVGMTPEVAAHAFDPFFTTKPIGHGTGLGLSMIYGFVRQSGGQVKIDSEPGKGTTVCIYLPRRRGEAPGADTDAGPTEAARGMRGQTMLVVEDEPLVRDFVTEALADLGYSILEAHDGAAAMKILESGAAIDLLITDVGLPNGMNGRQLAEAARQARPGLKVLFITGYAESALLDHGALEPGMHVMIKPFVTEALGKKVADLFATA
jgi:PAS domain S-box-containing protein